MRITVYFDIECTHILEPLFNGPSVRDSGWCSEKCAHNPTQELLPPAKAAKAAKAAKVALCKTIHFVGCVLCALSRYYLAGIVLCTAQCLVCSFQFAIESAQ